MASERISRDLCEKAVAAAAAESLHHARFRDNFAATLSPAMGCGTGGSMTFQCEHTSGSGGDGTGGGHVSCLHATSATTQSL